MTTFLTLSTPLPLDQNPAAVYIQSLGGLDSTGGRTQAHALRVVAEMFHADPVSLNWGALRYQHTIMIRSELAKRYSAGTANKILSALRRTLRQAFLLGQMSAEDYTRAIEVDAIEGETLPAGRELSLDEIQALITACRNDRGKLGARDAAIIAMLYAAGLRREEIASLSLDDYDMSGLLKVTGKRNKERTAWITNGARDALASWLAIRGNDGSALFVEVNKSDKLDTSKYLTPQAIYKMLRKRAKQAGVREFSPHDLRRTFVSHLLSAGADIATVSKMAGHANIQTTARYDKRSDEAKLKAAELLHIPY